MRVGPGASPIDTVYPYLDDDDGLRRDAAMARSLGFGAKLAVHPRQIKPVIDAFAPTAEERARAEAIVAAAEYVHEHGVAMVGGMMVDKPGLEWAEWIVGSGRVGADHDQEG